MANIYAQDTKIRDVKGRSKYISDHEKQEEIVLHKKNMKYDWSVYADYEKNNKNGASENLEAREIIVALPNKLSDYPIDLEKICDNLAKEFFGYNRDFEYAVHWNKERTNFHVHFLYSEREFKNDITPRTYSRDMWYEKESGKMAKANAENAELRFKKGDYIRDKEGNVKYNDNPFTIKDRKFHNKSWFQERNEIIQKEFQSHNLNLGIQNKETPYLSQRKIGHGGREDFVKSMIQYNEGVKQYNKLIKKIVDTDPEKMDDYIQMKKDVAFKILDFNSQEKAISSKSIEFLKIVKEVLIKKIHEIGLLIQRITKPSINNKHLAILAAAKKKQEKEILEAEIKKQEYESLLKEIEIIEEQVVIEEEIIEISVPDAEEVEKEIEKKIEESVSMRF